MSTVKSSNENLVLNADGTGKEIKLQNNGTTNVTLGSSGNMGIGTSSPNTKLHVNGRITTNDSALVHQGTGDLDNTGYAYYSFQNTSSTERGWLGFGASDGSFGVWNNANKPLKFATNGAERMRILSSGGITFNGDTAAANALDDYEEGTWTPVLNGGSGWDATALSSECYYTKIGNVVTIYGSITPTSTNTTLAVGDYIAFTGRPFAHEATSAATIDGFYGTCFVYSILGGNQNATGHMVAADTGTTYIRLNQVSGTVGGGLPVLFSGSYRID